MVIADEASAAISDKVCIVPDTLLTLQELAAYHRARWGGKLLAITGSNGKTTTKELVTIILSQKYKVNSTVGNLNNHIGVPLTLLTLRDEDIAVVEMGANHQGEIKRLCEIAQPDVGIITNIGKAHLEGFGGLKGVIKGKGELFDFLESKNKPAIVNMSLPELAEMVSRRKLQTFSYGTENGNTVFGQLSSSINDINGFFTFEEEEYSIHSELFGDYNFMNILAGVAIGIYFGVSPVPIANAIASYRPDNNRSQFVHGEKNKLILDAYNANPTSMKCALEEFVNRNYNPKMVILGDMLELGIDSQKEHEQILKFLVNKEIEEILLVGEIFYAFSDIPAYPFRFFNALESCMNYIRERNPEGYLILLKGSRKNSLEKTTNLLLHC